MKRHVSRLLIERGGLLALAAAVLYAWIAPSHLSTGDNAEFVALSELGGAAHPSGYPLYVLWLRAWSWLPVDTPAHAAALATGILGVTTLLVLHAACRAWGASATAASFAVAMVAATPIIVRLHTEAEVFALNGLVAATVLLLAAREGPLRGTWRAIALGLVAGLGMSNHLTCVFLAPIGVLGAIRGIRESTQPRAAAILATLAAFMLGLTPYIYLLVAPETRGSWGKVDGLGELVHHFLRMDYGGPGQLGPVDRGGEPGPNLVSLVTTHVRAYLVLPFLLGLGALVVCSLRKPELPPTHESRLGWRMLAVSWLLAGPILIARFNLRSDGFHTFLTQRFHVLPTIAFAVPVAFALSEVGRSVTRRVASPLLRSPIAGAALAAITMVALIGHALPRIASARSPATEYALKNMLRTLPERAVVIGTPDDFHFGMGYLQGVLGERPDVFVITWQQVGLAHARDRIRRELGITIEELPDGSTQKLSAVVAEQILATGRPLFIDSFQGNIAASFPVYPYGLLYRVLPRGTPLPPIDELFAINKALYDRYEFGYEFPDWDDLVPAEYHRLYAGTWRVIADALTTAGRAKDAELARQMEQALAPRP